MPPEVAYSGRGARMRIGQLAIGREWLLAVVAILVIGVTATLTVYLTAARGSTPLWLPSVH